MHWISILAALVFWHSVISDWNAAAQPKTLTISCPAVPDPIPLQIFEKSISQNIFWIVRYRKSSNCGVIQYPTAFPLLSRVQYSFEDTENNERAMVMENYVPGLNYHKRTIQEHPDESNYINNVEFHSMWYSKYTFNVDSNYAIFESHPNHVYRSLKKKDISAFLQSPDGMLDEFTEMTTFALYHVGDGYNIYVECNNLYAWVEIAQSKMDERFQEEMRSEIKNLINKAMPGQGSRKTRETVGNYEYLKTFFE